MKEDLIWVELARLPIAKIQDVLGARHRELRGRDRTRRCKGLGADAHRAISARMRIDSKNSGTASRSADPPEIPSQRDLTRPTSA